MAVINLASGSSFPYLFVFRHILNVILLCTIAYSLEFHCSVANAVQVSKAWGCEAAPTVQYVDVFKMITDIQSRDRPISTNESMLAPMPRVGVPETIPMKEACVGIATT